MHREKVGGEAVGPCSQTLNQVRGTALVHARPIRFGWVGWMTNGI